ncbi:MAG: histidine--tRNA ligase [Syntrophobacterales bacterium]|nr:histidine--tRNA ligase [Syntrophobacterales bacterium]
MRQSLQAVRGMMDILPDEVEKWRFIEERARNLFRRFGYREIRTPLLEATELFARSIGEATDIVEKEMYTFYDAKGRSISLRPEATASIIRAFIQHQLHTTGDRKFFLLGPMFRHERPQKGRYRQFHQIDVEAFGIQDPMLDAELMFMARSFLDEIGVKEVSLEVNTLGCSVCRPGFRTVLQDYLNANVDHLCPDCVRRIPKNPLRCFDCKVPQCKEALAEAPLLINFLCQKCLSHFESVKSYLEQLSVPYVVNPRMVRGLDYYVRTAFEIVTTHLGAQNAVGGGGRYDGLMKDLGGPDLPGIGFALGIERIMLLMSGYQPSRENDVDVYLVLLGDSARRKGFQIAQELRKKGLSVEMDYDPKSVKSQMRSADRVGATVSVIIGDNELEQSIAQVRFMKEGIQRIYELSDMAAELVDIIKGAK